MTNFAALSAAVASLVSCSSSSPGTSGGTTGTPTPTGPTVVHESAAPQCHDAANVADPVTSTMTGPEVPAAPVASGGTLSDGVYVLASEKGYWKNSDEKQTDVKETIVVAGTKWYRVRASSTEERATWTVSLSSSRVEWTYACSASADASAHEWHYSVSDKGFQLVDTDGGWVTISDYVRK